MPFSIQNANGVHIASLEGILDQSTSSKLFTNLKNSVAKGSKIILDFAKVPEIDKLGIPKLIELQQWCELQGCSLIIAGLRPRPQALLLEKPDAIVFSFSPSVEVAFQNLDAACLANWDFFATRQSDDEPVHVASKPTRVVPATAFSLPAESEPPKKMGVSGLNPPSQPKATRLPIVWNRWDDGGNSAAEPLAESEAQDKPSSYRRLAVIVALAVLAAVGGFELALSFRLPEILVEPDFVEVNQGQELPDVRVTVFRGKLAPENTTLLDGLSFDRGEQFHNGWDYYLSGAIRQPGKHVLKIHAARGSREAIPVNLTVLVKEVAQAEWIFHPQSLPLLEGMAIPERSYTKIVNGVSALTLQWSGEPAEGLLVEQKPALSGSWRMTGRPEKAGRFKGELIATRKDGKQETRAFEIEIRARPHLDVRSAVTTAVPSVPSPKMQEMAQSVLTNTVEMKTKLTPETEEAKLATPTTIQEANQEQSAIDDRMRTFLMERVEKANPHFTIKDKEMLRTIVSRLRRAARVATISFSHNQHRLQPDQVKAIQGALKNPEVAQLLSNPDCQVLVVGYASMTGSPTLNIRLSQWRARSVNEVMRQVLGRGADLCGDYGATDILSDEEGGNRVVEVYAGLIEISKVEEILADSFKQDFNRRHGGR